MIRKGSSVEAFLATSRLAKTSDAAESTEAVQPRSMPSPPAARGEAWDPFSAPPPVRDTAGELLALLEAEPLSPAAIPRRMGLSTTEAIALLERLEHFGFVTIASEGTQKLVKLTGS